MNNISEFVNTEFGELKVLMIRDKAYFPATECARALGYSNPRDAIARHCAHVVKHDGVYLTTNQHGVTTEQTIEANFIPEGDLYRLIVSSTLPAAQKFESWVFDEVLPTIRKQGYYSAIPDAVLFDRIRDRMFEDGNVVQKELDGIKEDLTKWRWLQMRRLWETCTNEDLPGIEDRIADIWKEDKLNHARARSQFWKLMKEGGLSGWSKQPWRNYEVRTYRGRRPKELDDPDVINRVTDWDKWDAFAKYDEYRKAALRVPVLEAQLKAAMAEVEELKARLGALG